MSQTILCGEGIHRELNFILQQLNCRKFLLVCDGSFPQLVIFDYFETLDVPYEVFKDFTPNPRYEDVCKGVALYRDTDCDAIVAVGGGSTIDVAKCIKMYAPMTGDVCYLKQHYEDSGIPLIALPTTAGTGSESTRFAVVYYEGEKQSVHHDSLLPNFAILDPLVLQTLPEYQKKCTLMDALCQAIESYWSMSATDESRELALRAIRGIMNHWRKYVYDGDIDATLAVLQSANVAGQAIHITTTTAPHAMSYKLTSLYGLPHGHAVGVCLPRVWKYMMTCGDAALQRVLDELATALGCDNSAEAIALLDRMMGEMGLRQPVSRDREKELLTLVNGVNLKRLSNHPIALSANVLRALYEKIVL